MKIPVPILLLTLALTGAGCTSLQSPRARSSDGAPNSVPVEKVSTGSGKVVTAHTAPHKGMLRVSGLLSKGSKEAPRGSHVDILLLDDNGKVTAAATSEYGGLLQHPSSLYGPRYSHYWARVPAPLHSGSTVRVVFHEAPVAECQLAQNP